MADENCALCDGTGRFTAVVGPDYGPCPGCTEPPAAKQYPAFELSRGTLWSVTVAYRHEPDAPHQAVEFWVVTASADGAEVYAVAMAKLRTDCPAAADVFVAGISRRGDVIGTVVRPRAAS